jgi:hypothetical protein
MAGFAVSIACLIVVSVVLGGWAVREDRRRRAEREEEATW